MANGFKPFVFSVVCCALLLLLANVHVSAQVQPPPAPTLSPQQLDDLVAPIALYPDSVLSQLLIACTYPLEVVEAWQWLQQHRNLNGPQLLEAARDQNWDPSVQALVVFPDVLNRLNQDVRWTTDLGNAFLAQQADVMDAVQRMRATAKANGRLQSTPQETVEEQTNGNQSAIAIQPTNPQVVYVPVYNPEYIWGPPVFGYYPPLLYPGVGVGFSFGAGIFIGGFFGGCCGWVGGGWGWGPSWFDHNIVINNNFFHRYGFHDFHRGDFQGRENWTHDPGHRLGVPYPNREMENRFRGGDFARGGGSPGGGERFGGGNFNRGQQREAPQERAAPRAGGFGSPSFERGNFGGSHSAFGGIQNGNAARIQNDHGFSSIGPSRMGGGGFRGGSFGSAPRGGGFGGGAPRGGGRR